MEGSCQRASVLLLPSVCGVDVLDHTLARLICWSNMGYLLITLQRPFAQRGPSSVDYMHGKRSLHASSLGDPFSLNDHNVPLFSINNHTIGDKLHLLYGNYSLSVAAFLIIAMESFVLLNVTFGLTPATSLLGSTGSESPKTRPVIRRTLNQHLIPFQHPLYSCVCQSNKSSMSWPPRLPDNTLDAASGGRLYFNLGLQEGSLIIFTASLD
ncbi:hypothetical protein VNO77_19976 [Canavalia gladiata]|uniref:Uncharacterized protein n=1 Tax=Canavalia gladiata TaxID=3824 RepID=A0AAN9QKZ8_CANGL